MRFRPYQQSNKEQCLELFRSNVPKFFAVHEESEFRDYLEHPDFYFVLEQEKILGCGGYGISGDAGYLAWGMVERSQHGTGLGKRLLLERLNLLSQHDNVSRIVLDTSQHTFGFFEKLGFTVDRITEDGYAPELHRYDMTLILDEGSRQTIKENLASLFRTKSSAHSVVNNQKEHHEHDE
jgi:ribosomal protein S18 acetylase RimI-like enzyme